MTIRRRAAAALLGIGLTSISALPLFAVDTSIQVLLWGKGETPMDKMDGLQHMGRSIKNSNMSLATMGIDLYLVEVLSGEITFRVANVSKVIMHQMTFAPGADRSGPLQCDDVEIKVEEETGGTLRRSPSWTPASPEHQP